MPCAGEGRGRLGQGRNAGLGHGGVLYGLEAEGGAGARLLDAEAHPSLCPNPNPTPNPTPNPNSNPNRNPSPSRRLLDAEEVGRGSGLGQG